MILFILEGEKQEPRMLQTIEKIYFNKKEKVDKEKDSIQSTYCSNIFSLYSKMKQLEAFNDNSESVDVVNVIRSMQRENKRNNRKNDLSPSYKYAQIFLFFDYDIKRPDKYNKDILEEQNIHIKEMLEYFNDETTRGKLYINYPMIESIRYFKKVLPDNDYYKYKIDIFCGRKFKKIVNDISFYKNLDKICLSYNVKANSVRGEPDDVLKENWKLIKELNIKKANYICYNNNEYPKLKDCISQINIFNAQVAQVNGYTNNKIKEIFILNAFPLFLYEYFK